jgi:CBS domain-containing protein
MRRSRVDQLPVVNGNKRLVAMLFDRELIKVLLPDSQGLRKS